MPRNPLRARSPRRHSDFSDFFFILFSFFRIPKGGPHGPPFGIFALRLRGRGFDGIRWRALGLFGRIGADFAKRGRIRKNAFPFCACARAQTAAQVLTQEPAAAPLLPKCPKRENRVDNAQSSMTFFANFRMLYCHPCRFHGRIT